MHSKTTEMSPSIIPNLFPLLAITQIYFYVSISNDAQPLGVEMVHLGGCGT